MPSEERERNILLQLVYGLLVLILVLVLFASFRGSSEKIEQTSIRSALDAFNTQLLFFHTEWKMAGKPRAIKVLTNSKGADETSMLAELSRWFSRSDDDQATAEPPVPSRVKAPYQWLPMTTLGWPSIASQADCNLLTELVFSADADIAGKPVVTQWQEQQQHNCDFLLDNRVIFRYQSLVGLANFP